MGVLQAAQGLTATSREPFRIGPERVVESIRFDDIQNYVSARSRRRYRGERIQAPAIEKELQTLGTNWRWGLRRGPVRSLVPWRVKNLTMPYAEPKPPFRTYEQVARKIARGGLTGPGE